jgi:hypothetical protein
VLQKAGWALPRPFLYLEYFFYNKKNGERESARPILQWSVLPSIPAFKLVCHLYQSQYTHHTCLNQSQNPEQNRCLKFDFVFLWDLSPFIYALSWWSWYCCLVDREQLKINSVLCYFVNWGFGARRARRQASVASTIVVHLLIDWAFGSNYNRSLSEEHRWQHWKIKSLML